MSLYPSTPRVPIDYPRLAALSKKELDEALRYGYVTWDPSKPPIESSGAIPFAENGSGDIRDWRMRMYVILFCSLYENFFKASHPLAAIEDLFLEFRTNILNGNEAWGLAQDFAGAGAWEANEIELQRYHECLRPYYDTALELLRKPR